MTRTETLTAAQLTTGTQVWHHDDLRTVEAAQVSTLTGTIRITWTGGASTVCQPTMTFTEEVAR